MYVGIVKQFFYGYGSFLIERMLPGNHYIQRNGSHKLFAGTVEVPGQPQVFFLFFYGAENETKTRTAYRN